MTPYNNHVTHPFELTTVGDERKHAPMIQDTRNALHKGEAIADDESGDNADSESE
jgi:hypothetical protein